MDIKDVEITIGSDPEFAILCGDSIENALEILSKLLEEEYRCTEHYETSLRSYFCTTDIGCDGSRIIGELRPVSSTDPIKHFKNTTNLVERLYEIIYKTNICKNNEKVSIVAGSYICNRPLGGHIHFGFEKSKIDEKTLSTKEETISTTHVGYIYNLLSNTLSFYLGIPIFLLENPENSVKRRNCGYGNFGDYEKKNYGLEFSMLSSWLVSPEIAIGTLALAYIVFYEIISIIFKNLEFLTPDNISEHIIEKYVSKLEEEIENSINDRTEEAENKEILENIDLELEKIKNKSFINGIINIMLANIPKERLLLDIKEFIKQSYKPSIVLNSNSWYSKWYENKIVTALSIDIDILYEAVLEATVQELLVKNSIINNIFRTNIIFSVKKDFNFYMKKYPYKKSTGSFILFRDRLYNITEEIIYPQIKQFKLYTKYKDYIDTIFEMITNKETWPTDDIMPRWKQLWT